MVHPKQFVSCSIEQMSECRCSMDHGSVHQDRTSYRCLARKSESSGLQIKFKRWGQHLVVSVSGVAEGHRYRSLIVVGACAPSGLNVNNNYDNDNDNIGVAPLRKFCRSISLLSLPSVGNGLYPTADHFPNFLNNCLDSKVL